MASSTRAPVDDLMPLVPKGSRGRIGAAGRRRVPQRCTCARAMRKLVATDNPQTAECKLVSTVQRGAVMGAAR
jgi:hypothetical protein